MTTIYSAKNIYTMNPARPTASHIAIRDGYILGAGSLTELAGFGEYQLSEQFADKTLMPGFVEGHSHAVEGKWWRFVYCGYFDRLDPHGVVWPGLANIDGVIERMAQADAKLDDPAEPLAGWAIDPIYYRNKQITRHDLDRISTTRPIGIIHASGHIMNVNTCALESADFLRQGIQHPGVPLGDDGLPTGELKGPDVMLPVGIHAGFDKNLLDFDERGLIDFARLCVRKGVTTATDLAAQLVDEVVEVGLRVTANDTFPVRIVALRLHHGLTPVDLIDRVTALAEQSTDRFRLGRIKVVADGSIQGFSARLRWPGYFNDAYQWR